MVYAEDDGLLCAQCGILVGWGRVHETGGNKAKPMGALMGSGR